VIDGGPRDLQHRAANAYVVWPLAALDLFREPDEATAWTRVHVRQAFVFGVGAAWAYLVLLALPLLAMPALAAEQIYVSIRGDSIRVAPHLHSDAADVDRLMTILRRSATSP